MLGQRMIPKWHRIKTNSVHWYQYYFFIFLTCAPIHVLAIVIWWFLSDFHGVWSFCGIRNWAILGILHWIFGKPAWTKRDTYSHLLYHRFIEKKRAHFNQSISDLHSWIVQMVFYGLQQKLTMRCLAISSYDRHSKICSSIQSGKSRRLMADVLFCITENVIVVYNKVNAAFPRCVPKCVFTNWLQYFQRKGNFSIACCCFL